MAIFCKDKKHSYCIELTETQCFYENQPLCNYVREIDGEICRGKQDYKCHDPYKEEFYCKYGQNPYECVLTNEYSK